MYYEGKPVTRGVKIHKKLASSLAAVFADIAAHFGNEVPQCVVNYSGAYADRKVRGSATKLSCHAFGAAIDLDAEHNPMNRSHNSGTMHPAVIEAFKKQGWFWGGDFRARQDPMHFQAAHEGLGVERVSCDEGFEPLSPAAAFNTAPDSQLPIPAFLLNRDGPRPEPAPSMFKSKQGGAAIGLGVAGLTEGLQQFNDVATQVSVAKWNAQQLGLTDLLFELAHRPMFWVSIGIVAAAVFVWVEHRKYKRLVAELKAQK